MLRIIADDLGLYKTVNDGIVFLLKEGKIDGASLMTNGGEFEDAVGQCSGTERSKIGIHLNLVEQASLVSDKPMPKNHRIFFVKYILGLIKKDYIRREFEAQIKKCIQSGIMPSFINGNQHLHLLPGIMDISIELAKKYKISYIRIVNEPLNISGGKLFRKIQLFLLNFLSKFAKSKIKKAGLRCNDIFIGFINAGKMSEADVIKAEELSREYPDRIIELGCHPGYEDAGLKEGFKHWGDYNWQNELNVLKNYRNQ